MVLSLDTWVSLAALAAGLAGMYGALRRELRSEIGDVRREIGGVRREIGDVRSEIGSLRSAVTQEIADLRTDLKADIARLDDRVYALAAGMRPPWEQKRAD